MTLVDEPIDAFFQRILSEALHDQQARISDAAEQHIVRVLTERATQGQDVSRDVTEPLTPRFLKAHAPETSDTDRVKLLQSVGDDALLLCGLFWQRIWRVYRQRLDSQSRISLGKTAYHELSFAPFPELADRYRELIGALMQISEMLYRDAEQIVRLVEHWRVTHDAHTARMLRRHGILVEQLQSKTPSS